MANYFSDDLFETNFKSFTASMGDRLKLVDVEAARCRRDQDYNDILSGRRWMLEESNMVFAPHFMPRTKAAVDAMSEANKQFILGDSVLQYIDIPLSDPHVGLPLLRLHTAIAESGFDPAVAHTLSDNLRPHFLVVLATGCGLTLQQIIEQFKPYHIYVAVSDWNDFVSSFWAIDWYALSNKYASNHDLKIDIGRFDTETAITSNLVEKCLAGLDYSIVYLPSASSEKSQTIKHKLCNILPKMTINYVGFVIDEHNMVWQAWQTLKCKPRVYTQPLIKPHGKFVVVGSGPSLDNSLDELRQLQDTHMILSCGSNYTTLKRAGIRVDVLLILERGEYFSDKYLDDYRETFEIYGTDETMLFTSVTSPASFHKYFKHSVVFFRPAVTPLAIFSNSPAEVLFFEGPQTINTGFALAAVCDADEVLLVGVDLGTRDPQKGRSADANGFTPRVFNGSAQANFGGTMYTERELDDTRIALEIAIKSNPTIDVFNLSDGVFIEGALPITYESYKSRHKPQDQVSLMTTKQLFDKWTYGLPRYNVERFNASWISRRPRHEVSLFFKELVALYSSSEPWFPTIIEQSTAILHLNGRPAHQFPRRLFRSAIHKLTIAISRQLRVMQANPQASEIFLEKAKYILVETLKLYERECYSLCDQLELTSSR